MAGSNDFSLELKNGVKNTSDAHLNAKYEVADNAQRDLLITQKQVKRGHPIYHAGDGKRYYLKSYPTPGSLVGVIWEEITDNAALGNFASRNEPLSQFIDVDYVTTPPSSGEVMYRIGGVWRNQFLVKADVGLDLVDNTPDILKPVSNPTQAALDLKFDKAGGTIVGDVVITGSVTIQGPTVQVDAEINTTDAVLLMNDGEVGAGVTLGFAGFEYDRGTANNFFLGFDEVRDGVVVGEITALNPSQIATAQLLATRADSLTDQGLVKWDSTLNQFVNSGKLITDLDNIAYTDVNNNFSVTQNAPNFLGNIITNQITAAIASNINIRNNAGVNILTLTDARNATFYNALTVTSNINANNDIDLTGNLYIGGALSTLSNSDLTITANGTGVVNVTKEAIFSSTLGVNGIATFDDTLILSTANITFTNGTYSTNITQGINTTGVTLTLPVQTGTIALVSDIGSGGNLPANVAYTDVDNDFSTTQTFNNTIRALDPNGILFYGAGETNYGRVRVTGGSNEILQVGGVFGITRVDFGTAADANALQFTDSSGFLLTGNTQIVGNLNLPNNRELVHGDSIGYKQYHNGTNMNSIIYTGNWRIRDLSGNDIARYEQDKTVFDKTVQFNAGLTSYGTTDDASGNILVARNSSGVAHFSVRNDGRTDVNAILNANAGIYVTGTSTVTGTATFEEAIVINEIRAGGYPIMFGTNTHPQGNGGLFKAGDGSGTYLLDLRLSDNTVKFRVTPDGSIDSEGSANFEGGITISGVFTGNGSGITNILQGALPSNVVYTDTIQTITAAKTFSTIINANAGISTGINSSNAGFIRLENTHSITSRNNVNSGNRTLMYLDSSNVLQIAVGTNTVFGGYVTASTFLVDSSSGWLIKNTVGNNGLFYDGTETILVNNGGFGVRFAGSTVNLLNTHVTGIFSVSSTSSFENRVKIENDSLNNHLKLVRTENSFDNTWDISLTGGGSVNQLTLSPENSSGYDSNDRLHISANRVILSQIDNAWDLGTSLKRFKNIYAVNFIGDGSQLTGITSGQLPSNVAYTDVDNNFSIGQTISGTGSQWLTVSSTDGLNNGIRLNTTAGNRQDALYRDTATNLLYLRAGTDDGEISIIAGGSTNEVIRINSLGIDVTGTATFGGLVTATNFYTTDDNTLSSKISRNSSSTALYVQQAGSGNIVDFRQGSGIANGGTSVFRITPTQVISDLLVDFNSTLDVSGASTFRSNVTIDGAAPTLVVNATNGSSGFRVNVLSVTSGNLFRVQDTGTTVFEINKDKSAVFQGAATFIGNAIAPQFQTDNWVAGVSGARLEGGNSSSAFMRFDSNEFVFYAGSNATNPLRINESGFLTVAGGGVFGGSLDVNGRLSINSNLASSSARMDFYDSNSPVGYLGYSTQANGALSWVYNSTELFRADGTNFNVYTNALITGSITATSFIKSGGLSTEFLMADGSTSTGGGGVSLSAHNNWTGQQYQTPDTLTDGTTINWSLNDQKAKVTLGGNRTFNTPTNIREGATYTLKVQQDGSGSRTISWNAAYDFGTDGPPTLSTTPNLYDILVFEGGLTSLLFIGIKKGFSDAFFP